MPGGASACRMPVYGFRLVLESSPVNTCGIRLMTVPVSSPMPGAGAGSSRIVPLRTPLRTCIAEV